MNLAMQLRRALITLSLTAIAMVCVVAKTAATTEVTAQLPAFDSNPVAHVSISKETFTAPTIALVRLGTPMRITTNRNSRKIVRCESITHS